MPDSKGTAPSIVAQDSVTLRRGVLYHLTAGLRSYTSDFEYIYLKDSTATKRYVLTVSVEQPKPRTPDCVNDTSETDISMELCIRQLHKRSRFQSASCKYSTSEVCTNTEMYTYSRCHHRQDTQLQRCLACKGGNVQLLTCSALQNQQQQRGGQAKQGLGHDEGVEQEKGRPVAQGDAYFLNHIDNDWFRLEVHLPLTGRHFGRWSARWYVRGVFNRHIR